MCEELELPIHIHVGLKLSGIGAGSPVREARSGDHQAQFAVPDLQLMGGAIGDFSDMFSRMIFSGMFDRFPGLQMIMAECGAGWVAHCIEHMDDHWWRNRVWSKSPLKEVPSYYWYQNWKAGFIREPFTVQSRHFFGVDNLMWANDYPHHRHDWPYSRRIIEETMAGVDPVEKFKMICGNAMEVYRLSD